MSLNFGFGLYDDNPQSRPFWDKKFEALSEDDKHFHHQELPWILMAVDIGTVSKETIPHILARMALIYGEDTMGRLRDRALAAGVQSPEEYLERFTGYQANVISTTREEFVKKLLEKDRRDYVNALPGLTKKQADKLPQVDDILVEEMPLEDLPLLTGRQWWSSSRGAREKFEKRLAAGK